MEHVRTHTQKSVAVNVRNGDLCLDLRHGDREIGQRLAGPCVQNVDEPERRSHDHFEIAVTILVETKYSTA